MRNLIFFFLSCLLLKPALAQEMNEEFALDDGSSISRYYFPEKHQLGHRYVDVWTPTGRIPGEPLAVLYVQDGQNLFREEDAFGGQPWQLHRTVQRLIDAGTIVPTMIVGIWHSNNRYSEYLPEPAFDALADSLQQILLSENKGNPTGATYLQWLVEELKPFIERQYSTYLDQRYNFIMGSSMGGLISSYALASYPEHFFGAACLSTHWPLSLVSNRQDLSEGYRNWLAEALKSHERHLLYMDYGTETLDAWYEPHQEAFNLALRQISYWQNESNFVSKKFEGAEHNEVAWRERADAPLSFLLRP
ncbi:MAG: alpha/beta hydrolase [Bacteroidia bacterium]